MKKVSMKWLLTCVLTAGLILAASALAPGSGSLTVTAAETETGAAVQEDGWHQDAAGWYYLQNGVRLSGGWVKIGDGYYYANAQGVIPFGTLKLGKKLYHVTKEGRMTSPGKSSYDGKYYYATKKGVLKTGFKKINKKIYYYSPKNGRRVTGVAKIGNYSYYFRKNGAAKTGWMKKGGGKRIYYFDPATGRRASGWVTIKKKQYYFDPVTGQLSKDNEVDASKLTGAWRIEVNRKGCFVVVYRGDTEVKAFVCSTAIDGVSTPTGTFYIQDKLRWHELNGPSYGQYCSHILPDILFHSVPNLRPNDNHSLESDQYNKLGKPASGGCIRLTVKSAKYLYDHCPIGTKVIISDSVKKPKKVKIEQAPKIPLSQNYDPTDPNA